MDDLLALLVGPVDGPWRYPLVAIALAFVIWPRLIEARRQIVDIRTGRLKMEREKGRLELLKLRYEIEALRKTHELPDLEEDAGTVQAGLAVEPKPEEHVQTPVPSPLTAWSAPVLLVLGIVQAILGFFFIVSLASLVLVPLSLFMIDEPNAVRVTVAAVIVYGLLAWASYIGYRRLRALRERRTPAS